MSGKFSCRRRSPLNVSTKVLSYELYVVSLQEYRQMLSSRAVAYLNLDLVLSGMDHFSADALPMLAAAVRQVAKKVFRSFALRKAMVIVANLSRTAIFVSSCVARL